MNSILGALVGDAAGATVEFYHGELSKETAENAMTMPGGGPHHVGPGQITDNGELTLTLWRSLSLCSPQSTMDEIAVSLMKGYAKWYNSIPFDIGFTCGMAFETYSNLFSEHESYRDEGIETAEDAIKEVERINNTSEANGAMMRATALAAWISMNNISLEKGLEYAKLDARLSHPNIVCQEANAVYVFAIVHLLQGKTPQEVVELTTDYVVKEVSSPKVKNWFMTESLNIQEMKCTDLCGHVRWAFVLAFYFLRNPSITYEDAIRITLQKGGDTDTNAAIVGGLVGVYQKIPEYMLQPVLQFDCTLKKRNRPREYSIKHVLMND